MACDLIEEPCERHDVASHLSLTTESRRNNVIVPSTYPVDEPPGTSRDTTYLSHLIQNLKILSCDLHGHKTVIDGALHPFSPGFPTCQGFSLGNWGELLSDRDALACNA